MAPRGRPKKGERRMDAALDAMIPYGFPNKLVRQTVDQLLKVYDGSWFFIEESAYTLLIDTILEKQQQNQNQDYLIEGNPGNGPNEASASGCSNRTLLLPCSSNMDMSDDAPLPSQAVGTISAASETGHQLPMTVDTASATSKAVIELPIKPVNNSAATSQPSNQLSIMAADTETAASKTVNERPIKPVDTSSATSQPSNPPSIKAAGTVSATNEINNQVPIKAIIETVSADNGYEIPQTKSSQPIGKLCHKRRRPCHGWISDDDEEEGELIELPALYKLVNGVPMKKKLVNGVK